MFTYRVCLGATVLFAACHMTRQGEEVGSRLTQVQECDGEPVSFYVAPMVDGPQEIDILVHGASQTVPRASHSRTAIFVGCINAADELEISKILLAMDNGITTSERIPDAFHTEFQRAAFGGSVRGLEFKHEIIDFHSFESRGYHVRAVEHEGREYLAGYRTFALNREQGVVIPQSKFFGVLEHGNPIGPTDCRSGETHKKDMWAFGDAEVEVALCSSVGFDQTTQYRPVGITVRDESPQLPEAVRGERELSPEEVEEYATYVSTHHNFYDSFRLTLPEVRYRWASLGGSRQFFVQYGDQPEVDVSPAGSVIDPSL